MKFTFKKGTSAFVGSVPFTFLEDVEVEAHSDSFDHLAEQLAAGPQRAFGEHLAALTHDEVITKDIDGESHEVTVEVTYGAGGARLTKEKGEPRKVKAKLVAAPPAAARMADAPPVTVTDATDPLAEKAREEFKERTDFRPPPGRFPDVIQTATDHPVDETGAVVEGDKEKAKASSSDKSGAKGAEKTPETGHKTDDKPKTDSFPVDFPGRTALIKAGMTRPSQLKGKTSEDLQKIDNIGPETAEKILDAVK